MSEPSPLSRPDVSAAFDRTVDLFITANEREEVSLMAQAGFEFARLAHLAGIDRDVLLTLVRKCALERIRATAGAES